MEICEQAEKNRKWGLEDDRVALQHNKNNAREERGAKKKKGKTRQNQTSGNFVCSSCVIKTIASVFDNIQTHRGQRG
jgi:hypothetical protein